MLLTDSKLVALCIARMVRNTGTYDHLNLEAVDEIIRGEMKEILISKLSSCDNVDKITKVVKVMINPRVFIYDDGHYEIYVDGLSSIVSKEVHHGKTSEAI